MTENQTEVVVPEQEQPIPVQEEQAHQEFTLDDLIGITAEQNEFFTDDAQYKGLRPLQEYLHHLPPDLQKNLANLRAMATRKTQELADLRRQVELERDKVSKEREMIVNSPVFKKLQEVSGDEEIDIWSEDGLRKAAQQEAAKILEQTFNPLREQIELEQAQARAASFVSQHPDAKDDPELRGMIVEALQQKEDLSLEDAYWLCKGKLSEARASILAKQNQTARDQSRQNLFKTSTGASTGAQAKPKFKTAEESLLYHMARAGIKE